jgi:hypothetical protein
MMSRSPALGSRRFVNGPGCSGKWNWPMAVARRWRKSGSDNPILCCSTSTCPIIPDSKWQSFARVSRGCQRLSLRQRIAHMRFRRFDSKRPTILKPVKESLLREAVERAIANRARGEIDREPDIAKRLWVQDGTGALQLNVADIQWVEAERDYMRLYLPGRSYLVHQSMRSLERQLPDSLFVRVHRSTIVRRDCIAEVRRKGRKRFVILQGGGQLPIGPRYADRITATTQTGRLGGSETVTE